MRKKAMQRWRKTLEWYSYKPRNDEDCWQPPEARKRQHGIPPKSLWKEHGPAINNLIQTSSFQNSERINVLSHPVCGHSLWQPQETNNASCPVRGKVLQCMKTSLRLLWNDSDNRSCPIGCEVLNVKCIIQRLACIKCLLQVWLYHHRHHHHHQSSSSPLSSSTVVIVFSQISLQ